MIELPAKFERGMLVQRFIPSVSRLSQRSTSPVAMVSLVVGLLTVQVVIQNRVAHAQAPPQSPAATPVSPGGLVGAWTLNVGLSDENPTLPGRGRGEGEGRSGSGGSGGRPPGGGGGGRGGHGGGYGGGGYSRGGGGGDQRSGDPDERMRQMNAIRDELQAPERLTITTTDTMVIMTAGDGRTSRLLLDGSAVKDETTHVERKTRWTGGKLVTDITGLVRGKITETYTIEPETHRMIVTLQLENPPGQQGGKGQTIKRVYDPESAQKAPQ